MFRSVLGNNSAGRVVPCASGTAHQGKDMLARGIQLRSVAWLSALLLSAPVAHAQAVTGSSGDAARGKTLLPGLYVMPLHRRKRYWTEAPRRGRASRRLASGLRILAGTQGVRARVERGQSRSLADAIRRLWFRGPRCTSRSQMPRVARTLLPTLRSCARQESGVKGRRSLQKPSRRVICSATASH